MGKLEQTHCGFPVPVKKCVLPLCSNVGLSLELAAELCSQRGSTIAGHLVYDHLGVFNVYETEWAFLILLLS